MKKVVTDIVAKRALFIDNYMYIVGEEGVVVLDEGNWEAVNELKWLD